MSGGFDAFDLGGFDLGSSLTSFAQDVGSVVTDFGTEFMSSFDTLNFEIPSIDVPSFGGFGEVGSFAGSASWFDTFNPGSILSSIPSVSDFNISSLTNSLPSLSSIKTAAGAIGLPTTASGIASGITKLASNPTALAAASAVTGVPPNLLSSAAGVATSSLTSGSLPSLASLASNPTAIAVAAGTIGVPTNLLSSAASVAGGALTSGSLPSLASLASSPAAIATATSVAGVSPNLINSAARAVDANGLTILNAAETAELTRNINPAFVNSLVDPGATREVIDQVTGEIREVPAPVTLAGVASQFSSVYDPETGTWSVFDNLTSTTVRTGLTEQDAIIAEQDFNFESSVVLNPSPGPVPSTALPASGITLGGVSLSDLSLATDPGSLPGTSARNLVQEARNQAAARSVADTQAQASDWRVRLRLAPNSTYLYNDKNPGILDALRVTDGVIFPYTPSIETAYKANYDQFDLTHSNQRGYFYKNSYVDVVNLRATFTAQDTNEANYLLAVIHFFRSCTKMFYGQDQQRGSPPPLVFLSGYGGFQFNEHPCVVSQFNYTLPPDVDYIRAQNALNVNTNMIGNRIRNPIANNPLAYTVNRLLNSGLLPGALDFRPSVTTNLPVNDPTYVPTKMEISISLLPIQSRKQVSNNFSVKEFANGNLLKGGYW